MGDTRPAAATDTTSTSEGTSGESGLGDLVRRLILNLRRLAFAELDVLHATYAERFGVLKKAVATLLAGAAICLAAVVALLMGLVLTLSALIGPLAATALVGIGGLALGGILIVVAAQVIGHQASFRLNDEEDGTLREDDDDRTV